MYETIFPADPPTGGKTPPGIYVLDSAETYAATAPDDADEPPSRPTTTLVKATITITEKTMRTIRATGTDDGNGGAFGPNDVHAETYSTSGTILSPTAACPTSGAVTTMPYSAPRDRRA